MKLAKEYETDVSIIVGGSIKLVQDDGADEHIVILSPAQLEKIYAFANDTVRPQAVSD